MATVTVMVTVVAAGCTGPPPAAPRAGPTTQATVAATTTVPTTLPLPPPPYQVSTTTLALVDPSRPTVSRGVRISDHRALTTVVWAPAIGRPNRWPLVVFAPGFQVGPDTYRHLLQTWAAAGYVVAAVEFPLADPAVAGSALDEGDLSNEPADLNFVLASLLDPAGPLAASIDSARIAVAGHSDGAEVALAVGQQGNPMIKAIIAMSGQPVVPQQAPNPPMLVIQGDQDTINPAWRSAAVYDQAVDPRFLLTLLGASHLNPYAGGSKWQPIVEVATVDFLNHYVAGTTSDDARLAADGPHPGLSTLR